MEGGRGGCEVGSRREGREGGRGGRIIGFVHPFLS